MFAYRMFVLTEGDELLLLVVCFFFFFFFFFPLYILFGCFASL